MSTRHAARAVLLDEADRILLCRHAVDPPGTIVWAAPGGGLEPGESPLSALRRELLEETGLALGDDAPLHVWHQEARAPGHDPVVNDYFLVRTKAFTPRGQLSRAELAAEGITAFRWWPHAELASYTGPDLFSPRAFYALLTTLIADGAPTTPIRLGL